MSRDVIEIIADDREQSSGLMEAFSALDNIVEGIGPGLAETLRWSVKERNAVYGSLQRKVQRSKG